MNDLFVTGTDTEVGKTILSALLTAEFNAMYWKPIQTGYQGGQVETDRQTVIRCAEVNESDTLPEAYVFDPPVSPHLAASQAGMKIDLETIHKPRSEGLRPLVIEGAGGVLVPINDRKTMLDLMRQLAAPIVIATRTTLGTINHTLLTINAVRNAGLRLTGVVMIGDENKNNRDAIEHYGQVSVIGWIPHLTRIDRSSLLDVFANNFDRSMFNV